MITNYLVELRFVRKYIGGVWIKTKERGWITVEQYNLYIGYKFDPVFIKDEVYKYKKNNELD